MNLSGFTVRGANAKSFSRIPPSLQKIIAYLDALPFKELTTTIGLSRAVGVGIDAVHKLTSWPEISGYKHLQSKGQGNLWGSKRTIKELKKQLARQGDE